VSWYEKNKLKVLGVLGVGVAVTLYINVFSGDSSAPVTVPAAAAPQPIARSPQTQAKVRRTTASGGVFEWKPRVGFARPEDRPDPATIDPTLQLELLAKIQNVQPEEATRNLFQYGRPVAVAATDKLPPLPTNVPRIGIAPPPGRGSSLPPPPSGPPPSPSPPAMTFKYYGYKVSKADGRKQAFLLDGDDIFIAGENDQVKSARYKVVKIGVSSITIEDTQFKSSQTIQLTPEPAAG
jgi:hypothetical protein